MKKILSIAHYANQNYSEAHLTLVRMAINKKIYKQYPSALLVGV